MKTTLLKLDIECFGIVFFAMSELTRNSKSKPPREREGKEKENACYYTNEKLLEQRRKVKSDIQKFHPLFVHHPRLKQHIQHIPNS